MNERSSRGVAIRTLERVLSDDAYASVVLDHELSRAQLPVRDRALASAIVYGTLRAYAFLDEAIKRELKRPDQALEAYLRAGLLTAAYQLRFLDRVPAYAVLDETVGLIRKKRGQKLSGFANAILRRLARRFEAEPRPSTDFFLPAWLERGLGERFGEAYRHDLSSSIPATSLRARSDRAELFQRIAEARPKAELALGELSEQAILGRNLGDPRRLPGFDEGEFVVQEEGSQCIAQFVGARPGEAVLDACAGRGGKTAILREAIGPHSKLVAADLHEPRLNALEENFRRLSLEQPDLHTLDLTVGIGALKEKSFDRVLVDAPCSGLGTIRRRPELLLRFEPSALSSLQETQRAILKNAARLVRVGGALIYAVCSPLREEGAEIVREISDFGFRAENQTIDYKKVQFILQEGDCLHIGPFSTTAFCNPDGYQLFFMRRVN